MPTAGMAPDTVPPRKLPWSGLRRFLSNPSTKSYEGVTHPGFDETANPVDNALAQLRVLVVGAGGLGCEVLKGLAMMAFKNIDVIDMDTIDLSNLNRQFLFRQEDVGRSKAEVAAEIIQRRCPSCNITAHNCRIEEKDKEFYSSFHLIICGLDSISARRWLNDMICNLLTYNDDGSLDYGSIVPLIDGGTEGFKGNARVILPGISPCIECTLNLYPPQRHFPLCTVAHTPRLPEHCVEYARVLLWPKEKPFDDSPVDGDDPAHVNWILEQALVRAKEFGISGVDYRLTQGVVKHIIPAVSSTNAVIAACCVQEAFKLATDCSPSLDNYVNFQALDGISSSVVHLERSDDCLVCSQHPKVIRFDGGKTLKELLTFFVEDESYQLKDPSLYVGSKALYVPTIPNLEEQLRPNLKLTLAELCGGLERHNLIVADKTRPNSLVIVLDLTPDLEDASMS